MIILTGYILLKLCQHKKAMSRYMSRHMLRQMSRPTRSKVQDDFQMMVILEAVIFCCGFIVSFALHVLKHFNLLSRIDCNRWSEMTILGDSASTLFIYVATSPTFRCVLSGYCRQAVMAPYTLYLNSTGRAKVFKLMSPPKNHKTNISVQPIVMKF